MGFGPVKKIAEEADREKASKRRKMGKRNEEIFRNPKS